MAKQQKFKPVDPKQNFVEMEKKLLDYWYKEGIVDKYLNRNKNSKKKFSFLDGPITANNPMGVHHAWGRTYKDLWQRFHNMQGAAGRFQNGFDEQGLWVEVEVEKELGFKNKKDIEKFGIDKFVNLCKERVKKFAAIQTEQSKRLGYFMDWDNSYHTSSDENNYAIWNFLKVCNQKGYLYKGRDSVPWCPRCGTAISQHEILTEEYKEITHKAVFVRFPVDDTKRNDEYLLVWTTTPWTLPSNVAIAVDPKIDYGIFDNKLGADKYIFRTLPDGNLPFKQPEGMELSLRKKIKGSELINLKYRGPFDDLKAVKNALTSNIGRVDHRVIAADPNILPISPEEGTGLVHIAPGAGAEDFQLSKKENLPVIESIDESAVYIDGFDDLTGKNAKEAPELIISHLIDKGFLFTSEDYTHRYPTCWRCKTELVWRVVDEWYIAMDRRPLTVNGQQSTEKTLRQQMADVAKKIKWIPKFGLERELDWLKNMHDWLISKERYWGLALPIWECTKCGNFEVIGSKDELKGKAVVGWEGFAGQSPHRPQIDQIQIKCTKCGQTVSRIKAVGNVWLDAGIVPFSTMPPDWFPADFITESFPGQFKNWFYSLIAMSTVLKNENSFKTVLGFATLLDEKGEEMHKSKGNAIEFNEAADKIGVDVMRWMYARQNPLNNLLFGYHIADEVRRRFYLLLWNVYSFFVTYANLNGWAPPKRSTVNGQQLTVLDRWILSRLNSTIKTVTAALTKYDPQAASLAIEDFVIGDLSTWYIRRSRDRVAEALPTIYAVLVDLSKLISPFMPFIAEEMHLNLVGEQSVNLADFPTADERLIDKDLETQMVDVQMLAGVVHAFRKIGTNPIKVRIPLKELPYKGPRNITGDLEEILKAEVNVKKFKYEGADKDYTVWGNLTALRAEGNQELREGQAREIIRAVQQARKDANCDLSEKVSVTLPDWPEEFEEEIKKQTLASKLIKGDQLSIRRHSGE